MASKKKKGLASLAMDELTRIHLQHQRHRLAEAKAKLRDKKLGDAQHAATYERARALRSEIARIEARYKTGKKGKARKGKRK